MCLSCLWTLSQVDLAVPMEQAFCVAGGFGKQEHGGVSEE